MVTFLPISSPFIRFAGRFVDDAFGVAAGWNFFVFEAALVPFEIVACNVIIGFWSSAVPTGAIIAIVIVLYGYVVQLSHTIRAVGLVPKSSCFSEDNYHTPITFLTSTTPSICYKARTNPPPA